MSVRRAATGAFTRSMARRIARLSPLAAVLVFIASIWSIEARRKGRKHA